MVGTSDDPAYIDVYTGLYIDRPSVQKNMKPVPSASDDPVPPASHDVRWLTTQEFEWAGGTPGFKTVRTKKLKGYSCEACRLRSVSHLWKA